MIKNLGHIIVIAKLILGVFIFFISITAWANSSVVKGCIAVFQGTAPISIEVELPAFSGGILQTNQFRFANLPKNMTTDEKGRYCYSMDDERFAFVHTFYYAVNEIEDYNRIFTKLGLPLGKTLEWTLSKNPVSLPTMGSTGITQGEISYTYPPNPSTLQHEVGHWVHFNAIGHDKVGSSEFTNGSADLLAVIHSGNSIMQKYEGYGSFYDINSFIRFPDHVVTTGQYFEQIVQDPILASRYPIYVDSIKSQLERAKTDPIISKLLNSPDIYINSFAINQPLWEAAISYGFDKIKILYVKTISMLNERRDYSYSELAQALIKNAQEINPELSSYLKQEYKARGILDINVPKTSGITRCKFDLTILKINNKM